MNIDTVIKKINFGFQVSSRRVPSSPKLTLFHQQVLGKLSITLDTSPRERDEMFTISFANSVLVRAFIAQLQAQGYEYLPIKSEQDLISNLRAQLEKLNDYAFSDNEWKRFFTQYLANANEGIEEKTRSLQEDFIKNLICDNGETKNIYLLD
ncbi:MAG: hypothetical protein LBU62_12215, partial [Bacteroidales bacterium]|nr:hypothetical protein [Bacteroidales bacterium]